MSGMLYGAVLVFVGALLQCCAEQSALRYPRLNGMIPRPDPGPWHWAFRVETTPEGERREDRVKDSYDDRYDGYEDEWGDEYGTEEYPEESEGKQHHPDYDEKKHHPAYRDDDDEEESPKRKRRHKRHHEKSAAAPAGMTSVAGMSLMLVLAH
eukprot:gnl/TRDRNA2_/TRDRNA2_96271_c1_seq1.p1 gnl/TRDRNA2_/TRDRNA2_96271_c1~~gnl/TRDRNA2_/TRDRNA2_96271_c1_seq1.p1  ORF type:complete len:153 (+),score=31.51 gnl/TRDRNA2_/TRDRNA2_96271_c1_seq1:100-558(+)